MADVECTRCTCPKCAEPATVMVNFAAPVTRAEIGRDLIDAMNRDGRIDGSNPGGRPAR